MELQAARINDRRNRTGAPGGDLEKLTRIEERIVGVMGSVAAHGKWILNMHYIC